MIIDIHTHTTVGSMDSWLSPEELVAGAKQAGLDGICITEHDWFSDEEALARLGQEYGITVLPGVEVSTEEGHILVFGVKRYVFGMHRAEFLRRVVKEAGGFMVMAHPYKRTLTEDDLSAANGLAAAVERASANPVLRLVDAVETQNGRGNAAQNDFSGKLGHRLRLKGSGGSDAHALKDIGCCGTRFQKRINNLQEFIAELKAGRFEAVRLG